MFLMTRLLLIAQMRLMALVLLNRPNRQEVLEESLVKMYQIKI